MKKQYGKLSSRANCSSTCSATIGLDPTASLRLLSSPAQNAASCALFTIFSLEAPGLVALSLLWATPSTSHPILAPPSSPHDAHIAILRGRKCAAQIACVADTAHPQTETQLSLSKQKVRPAVAQSLHHSPEACSRARGCAATGGRTSAPACEPRLPDSSVEAYFWLSQY